MRGVCLFLRLCVGRKIVFLVYICRHFLHKMWGNFFSFKIHFDIYNIFRGSYKIIYIKINLLYLVKL